MPNKKQRVDGHSLTFICLERVALIDRARVQGVLQAVAEEIKRDHGGEDQQARPDGERRVRPDQFLGVGQHVAPTGYGRLNAHAEKAQY